MFTSFMSHITSYLSLNLHISYFRPGKITIKRTSWDINKRIPITKAADYDIQLWENAMEQFGVLDEMSELPTGVQLPIHNYPEYSIISTIFRYNDTRYTGVHKTDGPVIIPFTGISMSAIEWGIFTERLPEIIEQCKEKKEENDRKRKQDSAQGPNQIKVYTWAWIVGGTQFLESGEEIYYTESDAKEAGLKREPAPGVSYPADNGTPTLLVHSEFQDPISIPKHVLLCYFTMLESRIAAASAELCTACAINEEDSLAAHNAKGNCKDDATPHVDVHWETAKKDINLRKLVCVFVGSRCAFSSKTVHCIQAVETVLQVLPEWYVKHTLAERMAGIDANDTLACDDIAHASLKRLIIKADKRLNGCIRPKEL